MTDFSNKDNIYFDGAADTAVSLDVQNAMKPYLSGGFVGNAHSIHDYGISASDALSKARQSILEDFGFSHDDGAECFFTSGATESNNWAIYGSLDGADIEHSITLVGATDHASIINPAFRAQKERHTNVCLLDPTPVSGTIGKYGIEKILGRLDRARSVSLLALSAVNNETGAVNDVSGICGCLYDMKMPPSHILIDCTQALSCGKSQMDLRALYPYKSLISFGGHKIFGPQGIGALICLPWACPPHPFIIGGEQEKGYRAGTSNVAGAVGLAAAVHGIRECDFRKEMQEFRQKMLRAFMRLDPECHENGCGEPNILNITIGARLLGKMFPFYPKPWVGDACAQCFNTELKISVSAGAACSASSDGAEPSHVLLAMGLTKDEISRTVRFSFSGQTTPEDIDEAIRRIDETAKGNK